MYVCVESEMGMCIHLYKYRHTYIYIYIWLFLKNCGFLKCACKSTAHSTLLREDNELRGACVEESQNFLTAYIIFYCCIYIRYQTITSVDYRIIWLFDCMATWLYDYVIT